MKEKNFIALGIAILVALRIAIIFSTPYSNHLPNIRIYESVGKAVLAGVNPYAYSEQRAEREQLRAEMRRQEKDELFATQERWDYYVSSNLPGSTALYTLFEWIAQGSRTAWRLLLALGDVGIFLGLCALIKVLKGRVDNRLDQAAILLLAVFNPILIVSGAIVPDDKQFQISLMLISAGLLVSSRKGPWRDIGSGLLLSISILFQLFGIFLLPLWAMRAWKNPGYALRTAIGGLLPVILSFMAFGGNFLRTAAHGFGVRGGAPWSLFAWLPADGIYLAKVVTVDLAIGYLLVLFANRKIDALNLVAGIGMAICCLWLSNVSLSQANIMLLFAVAAMTSLSSQLFFAASLVIVALGGASYSIFKLFLKVPLTAGYGEGPLIVLFVCVYFAIMATYGTRDGISKLIPRRLAG